MYYGKNEKDNVMRLPGATSGWMLRKGLSEEMTFRWRPERQEEAAMSFLG